MAFESAVSVSVTSSQVEPRGLEAERLTLERLSAASTNQKSRSASFLVPDALVRIFYFAIPDSNDTHTLRTAPTNISQVNTHWRSVALSSRRLWSTLTLNTDRLSLFARCLSHFALFLSRCGPNVKLPLDISITCHPIEFVNKSMNGWSLKTDVCEEIKLEGLRTVEGFFELLLPRRSSWRNVLLSLSMMHLQSSEKPRHWPLCIDNLSAIEMFFLSFPPMAHWTVGEPALIDFSSSTRLEKAWIRGHVKVRLDEGVKLENLVFLQLDLIGEHTYYPADADWYHLLTHAPNLATLNLSLCRGGPLAFLLEPDTLPRLRTLNILNRGPEHFMPVFSFLSSIVCPSLRSLEITTRIPCDHSVRALATDAWNPLGLSLFFKQSACPLVYLAIDAHVIDDTDLTSALAFIPSLRHLKIRHAQFPADALLVPSLALDSIMLGEELRCPELETLVFKSCKFGNPDCKLMVEMINYRWYAEGSKLRCFDFNDCNLNGFDEDPLIKEIRDSPRYWSPRSRCT